MFESLESRQLYSVSTPTLTPDQTTQPSIAVYAATSRQTFSDTLSTKAVQAVGAAANGAGTVTSNAIGMQGGSSALGQVSGLANQMQNTGGTSTQAA